MPRYRVQLYSAGAAELSGPMVLEAGDAKTAAELAAGEPLHAEGAVENFRAKAWLVDEHQAKIYDFWR
jgi:uncharacterized protein YciI